MSRMYRVIVLGGIALTACSGSSSSDATTGTPDGSSADVSGTDTFPTEGPAVFDSGTLDTNVPDVSSDSADTFPKEGADVSIKPETAIDTGADTFPKEGPMMLDGGGG